MLLFLVQGFELHELLLVLRNFVLRFILDPAQDLVIGVLLDFQNLLRVKTWEGLARENLLDLRR